MYIQHRSMEDSSLPMYLRLSSYKSVWKFVNKTRDPHSSSYAWIISWFVGAVKTISQNRRKNIRTRKCRKLCLVKQDIVCLSFIKSSTRNYLKPKRKANKQMHDFVKVCLMPIDQLPRFTSVSQTSGFRIIQRNSSAVDLWFRKQYRSS